MNIPVRDLIEIFDEFSCEKREILEDYDSMRDRLEDRVHTLERRLNGLMGMAEELLNNIPTGTIISPEIKTDILDALDKVLQGERDIDSDIDNGYEVSA